METLLRVGHISVVGYGVAAMVGAAIASAGGGAIFGFVVFWLGGAIATALGLVWLASRDRTN